MKFQFTAIQTDGKVIEGETEAGTPGDVLEQLGAKGLRPISIRPISTMFQVRRSVFGGSINAQDQIFITRYLALMLKVGTDLFRAIDILIEDFDKAEVKALLIEMRTNLEKGVPFYITFANHPKAFSPVFVNMVKSGEQSGNLDTVLENLSVSLEKNEALKSKIKGALIYPAILLVASLIILLGLVSFALPKLSEVFSSGNFNPPTFSRVVFAVGAFFGKYDVIILSSIAIFAITIIVFFKASVTFRKVMLRFLKKLPVVKKVAHRIGIQRFASVLAQLMKAGLPIIDALELTADSVGDDDIRASLLRISREGITKGTTIGDSFKRETAFPRVVTNLIAISEKSGHIDDVLDTIARFYEVEIDESLKTLVAFIEPVMLIGIGGIVATIALAIIVPIYQLVGQI
ncbi:MAG: type II secretion system F family protein [bacterium]|nr:type II secretion system F family protein [bacterium]